ncbi:MAG: hypothetical protein KAY24_00240 [Candidatus Eisenbacteria sp.]|nr:hypothetical protein [Candidatus Eisenbacteria bacterium]
MTEKKRQAPEATTLVFGKIYDQVTGQDWNITLREGVTFTDLAGLMQGLAFLRDEGKEYGFVATYAETDPGVAKAEAQRERKAATQKVQAERAARVEEFAEKTSTVVERAAATEETKATKGRELAPWEIRMAKARADAKTDKPKTDANAEPKKAPAKAKTETPAPGPGLDDAKSQDQLIGKIVIGGMKASPQIQMFSVNEKLQYPVLYAPSSVVISMLERKYGKSEETANLLTDVGEEYPVNWQIHWVPSPKNPKWKDLDDITKLGFDD